MKYDIKKLADDYYSSISGNNVYAKEDFIAGFNSALTIIEEAEKKAFEAAREVKIVTGFKFNEGFSVKYSTFEEYKKAK